MKNSKRAVFTALFFNQKIKIKIFLILNLILNMVDNKNLSHINNQLIVELNL